jgi:hypothetical protein
MRFLSYLLTCLLFWRRNKPLLLLKGLALTLLAIGLLATQPTARAATYEVGPGKQFAQISQVAPSLQPGDTVLVYANGTTPYKGVRLRNPGTAAAPITIRGVRDQTGRRPLMSDIGVLGSDGGANIVLSFEAGHYVFEGFEVTTQGTGRTSGPVINIHPWRGPNNTTRDIAIKDTLLRDCPSHGILSNDSSSGSILLSYVEVTRCGFNEQYHSVYLTTGDEYPLLQNSIMQIEHSYLHDNVGGNTIKLRSKFNKIYYNWIEGAQKTLTNSETFYGLQMIGPDDGTGGSDSNRRHGDVVGNVFVQNNGFAAIQIGGDGTGMSYGQYRMVNNTFLLSQSGHQAIRLRYRIRSLELENNIFANRVSGGVTVLIERDGPNWPASPRPLAGKANWIAPGSTVPPELQATLTGPGNEPGFQNLANYDLRLRNDSTLINKGTNTAVSPAGYAFPTPFFLPAYHPAARTVRPLGQPIPRPADSVIDIGAYEAAVVTPPSDPSLSLAFTPNSFRANNTTKIVYTLANPNGVPLTGVNFNHTLPSQLKIATNPAVTNNCNVPGTVGTTPGASAVSVSGLTLAANQTCTINVTITSSAAGSYTTATSVINTNETGAGAASNNATVNVTPLAPTIGLSFSPTLIVSDSVSTLSYTITNPNGVPLTSVAFTDTLPAQLFVGQTPGVTNNCGGSVTANPAGGQVRLSGGNLAANGNCQVTVKIGGNQIGTWFNAAENISSAESGTGSTSPNVSLQVVVAIYQATPVSPGNIIQVGATRPGATREMTLTVTNAGHPSTSLAVAYSLSGVNSGVFNVTPTNIANLSGGQSQPVKISCTPTTTGLVTTTLQVQTVPVGVGPAPAAYTLRCWGASRIVTKNTDDTSVGTLSEALATANDGDVIVFDLPANNKTITFSQGVTLTIKPGVIVDADCGNGPTVTVNGAGQSGDGLRLGGGNYISGLRVQGFGGRQITTPGTDNTLSCTVARK